MRRLMIAGLMALSATAAVAQGYAPPRYDNSYRDNGPPPRSAPAAERRWADAQARYRAETERYRSEWALYQRARGGAGGNYGYAPQPGYDDDGYTGGPPPGPGGYARAPVPQGYGQGYATDDRDENGYDASRYYRAGNGYQERVLAQDDRVYAGSDGRYYCKRSDGTTGLIVGGAAGGVLGNVIDGGHSRTAGTLIGGALGALVGRSVEQNQQQVRCR